MERSTCQRPPRYPQDPLAEQGPCGRWRWLWPWTRARAGVPPAPRSPIGDSWIRPCPFGETRRHYCVSQQLPGTDHTGGTPSHRTPPPPPEAGEKGQGQRATPTPSGANSAARLHVYVCHMCTRVCTHARRHTPASSMGPSILPGLRPPLLRLSPSRFLEKKPPLSLRPPEHRSPVGPLSLSCSTLGHVVGSGRDMPPTSCNERWPGLRLEL